MNRDVFRAVADPTRRQILDVLKGGPRPAGDLVARFPQVSQPTVSAHLKVLREAGLVDRQRVGRSQIYSLTAAPMQDVYEWVNAYRQFWESRLDRLQALLDEDA